MSVEITLVFAACGANQVVLYFELIPVSMCVDLGGASMQANISLCLGLALGYLIGVRKLFAVVCCLCWTWRCVGEATL